LLTSRKMKLLYVENDSALRGLVANLLKGFDSVESVFDFANGEDAIKFAKTSRITAALLDVHLGHGVLNGLSTAYELRRLDSGIGLVMYSQISLETLANLVDTRGLEAWSYVEKRADVDLEDLVRVLENASLGKSNYNWSKHKKKSLDIDGCTSESLTRRQNIIMGLLASGFEPKLIAYRLEISVESVRKDLSTAYAALVPAPAAGKDLRISAILKYQELVGKSELNEL
jgi:DNA-binding NarL/FixJ family response regulator